MKQKVLYIDKDNKALPVIASNEVRVAFVADDSFVDFLGVAINSIIENASKERFYDILVMTSDISEENMEKLLTLEKRRENISIRFVFIDKWIESMNFVVSENYNKFTFYRLLLPDITESMDKILYLDADIVVNADVASLYDIDFDGNAIVGTYDVQIAAWQNYDSGMRAYFHALEVGESGRYVQAGVLLFNLDWMRKNGIMHKAIMRGCQDKFIFNDQDLINIYFRDSIKLVNLKWNVLNLSEDGIENCKKYLNAQQRKEYEDARIHPCIVHYTGKSFPCYGENGDFAQLYWSYAKHTPFYDALMSRKKEYEKNVTSQTQVVTPKQPKNRQYKIIIKECLKKVPFLVSAVRYVKHKKQAAQVYSLNFTDMEFIGGSIINESTMELKPGAEVSGMHYNWGKGIYKMIIPVESVAGGKLNKPLQILVYAGYRHILLLEKDLQIGRNELNIELKETQLDVELVIKNNSDCKIDLGTIVWNTHM